MAWQMKLLTYVVLLLQMGSGILAMVAFFSDYWGVVPAIPAHFGLTRICTERSGCDLITVSGAGSVFFLLLVAFLLGFVLALTCAIMELIRTYACFGFLTVVSLLQALMSFAGMVHSVVVFNAFYGSEFYYSWSFALGWLCVVTSVISGMTVSHMNGLDTLRCGT
ncbi:hypothetical protein GDO81_028451 [Engystomops pustulosus]|uniref:Uncharacterized protein n=1 Tax=Engystomops pustulosus TaxID=76066 RepID=A0AAV6Z5F1_ENGPU|nr:hypothetical protein GDO81_028451 [Engystomops pustulosus]